MWVESALHFSSQNRYGAIIFVSSLLVLTLVTSTHAISTNRIDLVCRTYHTISDKMIKAIAIRILFRETANKNILAFFIRSQHGHGTGRWLFSSWTALILNRLYYGFWCQSDGRSFGINSHVSGLVIPDCLRFIPGEAMWKYLLTAYLRLFELRKRLRSM